MDFDSEIGTDLERAFDTQLRRLGQDLPVPKIQYRFSTKRKFTFDRAFVDYKVAIELEGIYTQKMVICQECGAKVRFRKRDGSLGKVLHMPGYHQRYGRFKSDKEKYNLAVEENWAVLRFLHDDVYGNPFDMVEQIRRVLYSRRYMAPLIQKLSDREYEILHFIAAGFSGNEIADKLELSEFTVRGHTANIRQKMVAKNQAAAVARAICWGMLDLEKIPWPEDMADVFDIADDKDH